MCSYGGFGMSVIDFAVDEIGMWIIHGEFGPNAIVNACPMLLSRADPDDLTIIKTWNISQVNKYKTGNAFMVCGVLYITDTVNNSPTYIKYTFDNNTGKLTTLENNTIPFQNKNGLNVYLSYNPRHRYLYAGQLNKYKINE